MTDDVVWHISTSRPPPTILGQPAKLILNRERRLALMRYHTVLHVLNTIALREYGGWITGVQIAADYSRIDFKLDGFSAAMRSELERKVNAVLDGNHAVTSYSLPEADLEFHSHQGGKGWGSSRRFSAGDSGELVMSPSVNAKWKLCTASRDFYLTSAINRHAKVKANSIPNVYQFWDQI